MARALDIVADLALDLDGEEIAIRGDGARILIDVPSLQAARALVEAGPLATVQRSDVLQRLNETLRAADLTAEIRCRGETLVRLGADARPGAVPRLLRLGNVELRPARLAQAAARDRPAWTVGIVAVLSALVAFVFFWRRGDD